MAIEMTLVSKMEVTDGAVSDLCSVIEERLERRMFLLARGCFARKRGLRHPRHCGYEALCVLVCGGGQNSMGRAGLDDLSLMKNCHAITYSGDGCEIV